MKPSIHGNVCQIQTFCIVWHDVKCVMSHAVVQCDTIVFQFYLTYKLRINSFCNDFGVWNYCAMKHAYYSTYLDLIKPADISDSQSSIVNRRKVSMPIVNNSPFYQSQTFSICIGHRISLGRSAYLLEPVM